MFTVPKPYPKEFREDVIRVARGREPGVNLKDVAADFGISESCLNNWLKRADIEDGVQSGTTAAQNAELAKQRAMTVAHALEANGVPKERIQLQKPELLVGSANADEARRVEVRLQ